MRFPRITVLSVSLLLLALRALGQSPNGNINGLVLDPTNRVIAGAEIIAVNDLTGVQFTTKTNDDGVYVLPNLPPGPYRLQVSKTGFKTLIKPDITLSVQDALSINFTLPIGALLETVTVTGGAPLINSESPSVSTVIDRHFVEELPLNGRTFNTLLQLTPGVVIAQSPNSGSPGQFSVAGQRTSSNTFTVDGVSANFGVQGTFFAGQSGTGSAQAFSALGGTNSLVSVDALREFRIETSSFAPEFGKTPGGQVLLTTRSGTNKFHGDVFDYFRNDVMDANDWFANNAGQPRAAERHNDFGGSLGGPITKDKTFFFFSYEGARLRLPQTQIIQVPSADVRDSASTPSDVAPLLKAYPLPNGPVSPDGFTAQFTGTFSNSATLNATSLRLDHTFNQHFSVFGRYNYAPSDAIVRAEALSEVDTTTVRTQTLTVGLNAMVGNALANSLRGNYSKQSSSLVFALDSFSGAVPPDPSLLLGSLSAKDNSTLFTTFDTVSYSTGPNARNRASQMEIADDLDLMKGTHHMKFGVDYRGIFLDTDPRQHLVEFLGTSVQDLVSTGTGLLATATSASSRLLVQSYSLYAQDTWKAGPRLTLTYGLRWELNPAPGARGSTSLAAWQNLDNPGNLSLSPARTPIWNTTYGNIAPRFGFAYSLTDKHDLVLRAGTGIFYDLGVGSAANLASDFPNFATGFFASVPLPIGDPSPYLPALSRQPPFPFVVEGFAHNLKLPRSYQWNIALEKSFAGKQALSVTYLGQAGRQLLRQEDLYQPNPDFTGVFEATRNSALSKYDALQIQFRRPLSDRLQMLLNYAWSHSFDNSSNDVVAGISGTVISAASDYASSSFDVRHSFSGAMTYELPAVARSGPLSAATRDWSIDVVIVARSGFPFNGQVSAPSPALGVSFTRPDLVPGVPVWIADPAAPAQKRLNPDAFAIPATPRQGTEGRNDISGFGLTQVDLSISRKIPFTDQVSLLFRADTFNVFNHPNFTNPVAIVGFGPSFLQSSAMLNQGLGGLSPLFQEGGPRSLQLSLRLSF